MSSVHVCMYMYISFLKLPYSAYTPPLCIRPWLILSLGTVLVLMTWSSSCVLYRVACFTGSNTFSPLALRMTRRTPRYCLEPKVSFPTVSVCLLPFSVFSFFIGSHVCLFVCLFVCLQMLRRSVIVVTLHSVKY